MHKINPLVTVLHLIFKCITVGGMGRVLCSCPRAGEHSMQIICFIHIVSREFLRNKCDSPSRQDGKKPLGTFALGGEGQRPQYQTGF